MDQELKNCEIYSLFRCNILKFIRAFPNSFFNSQNIIGIRFVTRSSHLQNISSSTVFKKPLYNCSIHCVKCVLIRSYTGPYFLAFGLNTDRYSVSLRIQSKCGKMRTRANSVFEHFSRSGVEKCRTEQLRSNRIGPNKLNARWESNFRIVKGCFYELIRKIELLIRHQKNE